MLNSEVLDIMQGRLGKRTSNVIRLTCLQELNQAIRELERAAEKPWFLEATATGSLVVDQDYLTLPADFLIEVEDGTFEFTNSEGQWTELFKKPREVIRKVTANEASAPPEAYAIWGNKFLLGPKPDVAYAYRFDYFARTSIFADNGSAVTNDWLIEFFDYVVFKALIVVSRDHIQSDRVAANMLAGFSAAKDSFFREVTARKVSNETYLLTDEEE